MSLAMLRDKMAEYFDNGVRPGSLIDSLLRQAHMYRPGQAVEILDGPRLILAIPSCRDSRSTC